MKRILVIILGALVILCCGCRERYRGPITFDAEHKVYDSLFDSYLRVLTRPEKNDGETNLKYSLTVLAHLQKNEGITKRYYNYYQVDWKTDTDVTDQYYHVFDTIDGATRSYNQNFHPYAFLDGNYLTTLKVIFQYEYDEQVNDIVFSHNEQYTYLEDIIAFNQEKFSNDSNTTSPFEIKVTKTSSTIEDHSCYNVSIMVPDEKEAHIDVQSWYMSDGEVIPFYGIYHYQLDNGNYDINKPGIDINDSFSFDDDTIYFQINLYQGNEKLEYYYQARLN